MEEIISYNLLHSYFVLLHVIIKFLHLKVKKSLACKLITGSYAQPKYDPSSLSD